MYKTTDSQDLKLKNEDQCLRHGNYYIIAKSNLLQISIRRMPVVEAAETIVPLAIPIC